MPMLGRMNSGALQSSDNPKLCTSIASRQTSLMLHSFSFCASLFLFNSKTNNFGGAYFQLTA